MLSINEQIRIPDEELVFSFARSGGPGGQNVNKVASKAFLHWNMAQNATVPETVKARLRSMFASRITVEGEFVIQSQEFRDQERNRAACVDKLREFILKASVVPKPRKRTKPSRGSKERRLAEKKRRSSVKSARGKLKDD